MSLRKNGEGFPKIRGTVLGVLIIRTIVFWGLHWGPLILGNYHIEFVLSCCMFPQTDYPEEDGIRFQ